jgi:hypothetical protein
MDVDLAVARRVSRRPRTQPSATAEDAAAKEERGAILSPLADPLGNLKMQPEEPPEEPRRPDLKAEAPDPLSPAGGPEDDAPAAGRPLSEALRRAFEQALSHQLDHVRIHEGSAAAEAAERLGADAFAAGADVVLGRGASPGSAHGLQVLAHELIHVVQHDEGKIPAGPGTLADHHPLEREAWGREAQVAAEVRDLLRSEGGPQVEAPASSALQELGLGLGLLADLFGEDPLGDELIGLLQEGARAFSALSGPAAPLQRLAAGVDAELLGELLTGAAPLAVDDGPDAEAWKSEATTRLVLRLAGILRIPAPEVRLDEAAAAQASRGGARGAFTDGAVLLDPSGFDPTTQAGRRLVAHELVHAAQARLPGEADPDVAEAEAMTLAPSLAAGRSVGSPIVPLSASVAFDKPLSGEALWSSFNSYKSMADQGKDKFAAPRPDALGSNPAGDARDDERDKVSRYSKGVDGIADRIGKLKPFDDLCDAIGDGGDTRGPLDRVRGTSVYQELCDMWQGAVDGGTAAQAMKGMFDYQFKDRGFWGETEQAFAMVSAAAKRDAKRNAEAEAARKQKEEADRKAKEEAKKAANRKGADKRGDVAKKVRDSKVDPTRSNPDLEQFMDDVVPQTPPDLVGLQLVMAVKDGDLDAITAEQNHQLGVTQGLKTDGVETRAGQIGEVMLSALGNGAKSFGDQFFDTFVTDTLAGKADKFLQRVPVLKNIKTPFVGPLVGVLTQPPWSDDYWKGAGDKWGNFTKKGASSLEMFGKIGTGKTGLDNFGIFCAAMADLFSSIASVLDLAQQIIGTLSALCYVVGGVLLAIGLAFFWCGAGALIGIGGWLLRAGGLLARINTILGNVLIIVSLFATVFRTVAAFLVPAELYAEQLGGLSEDANTFSNKAGGWAGDQTASGLKTSLANRGKKNETQPQEQENPNKDKGDELADQVKKQGEKTLDEVDADVKAKQKEQQEQEAKNKKEQEAEAAKKKEGEGEKKPGLMKRLGKWTLNKLKSAWAPFGDLLNHTLVGPLKALGGLVAKVAGKKDLSEKLLAQVKSDAMDGLGPVLKLRDDAKAMREKVKAMQEELDNANIDPKEKDKLLGQLKSQQEELARAEAWLNKDAVKKNLDALEASADGQRVKQAWTDIGSADKPAEELKKEKQAKIDEKEQLKKRADAIPEEVAQKKKALEDAALKKQEADEQLKQHDEEGKKRTEALEKHGDMEETGRNKNTLEGQVADLRQKAAGATEARQKLELAETKKQSAEMFKNKVKDGVAELKQEFKGSEITVKGDGGIQKVVVHDVTATGVVVTEGGTKRTIPWDQVHEPQLKRRGPVVQRQQEQAQELKAEAQKLEGEAKKLNPNDQHPRDLQDQIKVKEEELKKLQASLTQGEALKKRVDEHAKEREPKATGQSGAAGEVKKLEGEIKKLEEEKQSATKRMPELDKEAADIDVRIKEAERLSQQKKYQEESTSANATGGVGSSYKGWVDGVAMPIIEVLLTEFLGIRNGLGALWGKLTSLDSLSPNAESTPSSAGGMVNKGIVKPVVDAVFGGTQLKSTDAVKKAGELRAQAEILASMAPPEDMELMLQERQAALDAAARYQAAHDIAYAAYNAEVTTKKIADKNKELYIQGGPIVDASKKVEKNVEKSKQDEEKRRAEMDKLRPEVPNPDSGMSGLVTELIAKMMENGDEYEGDVKADPKQGANVSNTQDLAKDSTETQSDTAKKTSEAQAALLDDAVSLASDQQMCVEENVDTLKDKYTTTLTIHDEIRYQKASALADREKARQDADKHGANFAASYANLSAWSQQYAAQRQKVEALSGQ